ncbi:mechanosensitive ion channel family protein [Alkaliphilus transvaalensis]|uniref:mechanosensitive ion channel family protein n=1 Tax=Alkaliphilus transvaalensis TaxID=114628 RepID=UPI00241878A8|nr:mechanosensitive ion channel family protein [Alkaliphilus transvaalensis]
MYLDSKIVVFVGIVLGFIILRNLFSKVILKYILSLTKKTKTNLDTEIVLAIEKPLKVFIVIIGFYLALQVLDLTDAQTNFVTRVFRSSIIILIAWSVIGFSNTLSSLLLRTMDKCDLQIEGIFIPLISKGIKIIIIVLACSIVAEEWGYDVNSFIAGLGIGGLAFALAAKDTLANIFGGLVLTLDKPFGIGDWICTPNLEGTVEEISFRSTKVRTFAHALVHVPNSTLVNQPITNWSRMGKRRITFNLGVEYGTTIEQMKKCIQDIKDMLQNHEAIHKETIFVNFDRFNDSSLDIFIYCFTISTNWGEFLQSKEDVNLKILEILQNNNVHPAFPSRSIYVRKEDSSLQESISDPIEEVVRAVN